MDSPPVPVRYIRTLYGLKKPKPIGSYVDSYFHDDSTTNSLKPSDSEARFLELNVLGRRDSDSDEFRHNYVESGDIEPGNIENVKAWSVLAKKFVSNGVELVIGENVIRELHKVGGKYLLITHRDKKFLWGIVIVEARVIVANEVRHYNSVEDGDHKRFFASIDGTGLIMQHSVGGARGRNKFHAEWETDTPIPTDIIRSSHTQWKSELTDSDRQILESGKLWDFAVWGLDRNTGLRDMELCLPRHPHDHHRLGYPSPSDQRYKVKASGARCPARHNSGPDWCLSSRIKGKGCFCGNDTRIG